MKFLRRNSQADRLPEQPAPAEPAGGEIIGTLRAGYGTKLTAAKRNLQQHGRPPKANPVIVGLAVAVLVFTVAMVSQSFSQDILRQAFDDQIRGNLKRLAKAAATTVDAKAHEALVAGGSENSAEYVAAISTLERLQNSDKEISYVYTCVLQNGKAHFVLDPTEPGDHDGDGIDDKSYLMQEYPEATPELMESLRTGVATAEIKPYTDRWGTFISGYAPIKNEFGRPVGVVGIDLSADNYEKRLAAINDSHDFALVVTLMLALLSGLAAGTMQHRSSCIHRLAEERDFKYREQIALTLERLESALKIAEVSRNRFSDLFEGIPVSCLTFDTHGHVFEWNSHALTAFGLQAHEIMGKSIGDVLGNRVYARQQQKLVQEVIEGRVFSDSTWSDGDKWFLFSGHPLFGPDGEVTGGILAAVDISRQKKAEDEVQQQLEALNRAHADLNRANLQLQEVNTKLETLATTDMLTGLPNRRAFFETLQTAFEEAKRGQVFSLVQADIDYFKLFNDVYGHQAGDDVLCLFASTLKKSVRPGDLVARHGGEEFYIVLRGANKEVALSVVERIREAVSKIESGYGQITASFGLATWQPSLESEDELMQLSDDALYEAKRTGRNRVVYFEPVKKAA